MTTDSPSSRPARKPLRRLDLPPLPELREPLSGRLLCAVEERPGVQCGSRHCAQGRCGKHYWRDYRAEQARLAGLPLPRAPTRLGLGQVKWTLRLPPDLAGRIDAQVCPGERTERIRQVLEAAFPAGGPVAP